MKESKLDTGKEAAVKTLTIVWRAGHNRSSFQYEADRNQNKELLYLQAVRGPPQITNPSFLMLTLKPVRYVAARQTSTGISSESSNFLQPLGHRCMWETSQTSFPSSTNAFRIYNTCFILILGWEYKGKSWKTLQKLGNSQRRLTKDSCQTFR